jgi:hypothetical protein
VFRHNRRVLDAWIHSVAPVVRGTFFGQTAVKQREVCVPSAVTVDGRNIPQLDAGALRMAVDSERFALTIEGEGGAGKSTLAFAIARFAIASSRESRLRGALMIPILVDTDFVKPSGDLMTAVAVELGSLTRSQQPLAMEFVRQLLARQRILVIVDGFSERSEKTRSSILKGIHEAPVSAVVFTSRGDVDIAGAKTVIRPQRIQGNSVATFLHGYLELTAQREIFKEDEEFFKVCKDLSALTKNRDITPLLAKMYAEYAVARQRGVPSAQTSPDTIPALISCYVNTVSAGVPSKYSADAIQGFLRVIAWECVKGAWIPGIALREHVRNAIGTECDEKLTFAIERLQLAQASGLGVRFAIDPLAEYLAAMHLLMTQGKEWSDVLERLRTDLAAGRAAAFLAVLLDCYRSPELRGSLGPEVAKRLFHGDVVDA